LDGAEAGTDWQQAGSQLSIAANPVLFNSTISASSRQAILVGSFTSYLDASF
jgi:hypothetical protein